MKYLSSSVGHFLNLPIDGDGNSFEDIKNIDMFWQVYQTTAILIIFDNQSKYRLFIYISGGKALFCLGCMADITIQLSMEWCWDIRGKQTIFFLSSNIFISNPSHSYPSISIILSRILGSVEFKQIRLKNDSCSSSKYSSDDANNNPISYCYSDQVNKHSEERDPFGDG